MVVTQRSFPLLVSNWPYQQWIIVRFQVQFHARHSVLFKRNALIKVSHERFEYLKKPKGNTLEMSCQLLWMVTFLSVRWFILSSPQRLICYWSYKRVLPLEMIIVKYGEINIWTYAKVMTISVVKTTINMGAVRRKVSWGLPVMSRLLMKEDTTVTRGNPRSQVEIDWNSAHIQWS